MRVRPGRTLLIIAAAAITVTAVWQTHKPLPAGMHVASPVCTLPGSETAFISDITAADAYGHAVFSQGIQDQVLQVIGGAQRFVVLDYALIGAAPGGEEAPQRRTAGELVDALVRLKGERPAVRVLLLTDPGNERFGTARDPQLALLRAAGVEVVPVALEVLRDPNFLYSALWRLTLSWWGGPPGELGVAARALNFKADHRKVVIADDARGGLTALVGSANPLERESAWSNAALRFSGAAAAVLLKSELAVAHFSGWRGAADGFAPAAAAPDCDAAAPASLLPSQVRVQVLTEGAIRQALLEQLAAAVRGDSVDIAAFKLADRGVLDALLDAARRGVRVRLILDPSEDATTLTPSGLPNQPLASELVSRSNGAVRVRWYRTHGERFHTSLALISGAGRVWLLVGSANFTRRGLEDYNLDADVALELTRDAPLADQVRGYFETLWSNRAALGIEYTADFAAFANPSQADYWLCRLLEGAGLVAF